MIRSFRCKDTQRLAAGYRTRRFAAFERVSQRKLAQLDAAATLEFSASRMATHTMQRSSIVTEGGKA